MNRKLAFAFAAICLAAAAANHAVRADDEGKTITVSADNKPVFTIKLPAGWTTGSDPVTLTTSFSDSSMDVTGQFDKLGELDAAAAKNKAAEEAQLFLMMNGDDKNVGKPTAADKEIAGNKGFAFSTTYKKGDKTRALRLYGFTPDGKTYYEVILQGSEDKLADADSIAESIAAAK